MHRLEKQLTQLEMKHGVTVRWDKDNPQYTCARLDCLREKKQNLQSSLWATISRRQYLLKFKKRYAGMSSCLFVWSQLLHVFCSLHTDGQKIAKRLCKGISRESSKAKQVLEEYNAVSSQIESSFQSLSLEEVLSPTCSIWQSLSTAAGAGSMRPVDAPPPSGVVRWARDPGYVGIRLFWGSFDEGPPCKGTAKCPNPASSLASHH